MLSADKWEHSLCGQWETCSPSCSQKPWVASFPAAPNGSRAKATLLLGGTLKCREWREGLTDWGGGGHHASTPTSPSRCDHARALGNSRGLRDD